jgi:hypothetical protein
MAKDAFHDVVKTALEKNHWHISTLFTKENLRN